MSFGVGCAVARLRALLAKGRYPVVCGKGPSLDPAAAAPYVAVTLNHACRVVPPALACFVDLEAFAECDPASDVALPWSPNLRFKPGPPLDVLAASGAWPALARAAAEGRLYAYNRRGCRAARRGLQYVTVSHFSATAAFGLLVLAGARVVYSTGVDGGQGYAPWFDAKDRLANGRPSFDPQTKPIRALVTKFGARWKPLPKARSQEAAVTPTPVRVFIGTEPKTEIARKVLEFSIRRRSTLPVEFTPMIGPGWEYPLDGIKVGTGFSLRRWMIPAYCGYAGRAVYMDADQLVFDDVAELWRKPETVPAGSAPLWCTFQPDKFSKLPWPQTSVMVINCEAAQRHWGFRVDEVLAHLRKRPDQKAYADFMHAAWLPPTSVVRIGNEWNHLNAFTPKGKPKHTRLLHYTKEPEQPWYKPDHPLSHLWEAELAEAIKAGVLAREEFEAALANFGVREDWRKSNGLHPFYAKYLELFPAAVAVHTPAGRGPDRSGDETPDGALPPSVPVAVAPSAIDFSAPSVSMSCRSAEAPPGVDVALEFLEGRAPDGAADGGPS